MSRTTLTLVATAALALALATAGGAFAGGFCAGYEAERVTDRRGTTVAMSKNCFGPTVLRVERGHTVTFANKDPEPHTVGGTAGSFGDMHREIGPGKLVSYRFRRDGVFPYVCLLHPGMAGAIVVGDGIGPAAGAAPAAAAEVQGTRGAEGQRERNRGARSSTLGRGLAVVVLVAVLGAAGRRALLALRREAKAGPVGG